MTHETAVTKARFLSNMSAYHYSNEIVLWLGLFTLGLITLCTLYFFGVWALEKFLERPAFTVGAWRMLKVAIRLGLTRHRDEFVADYVSREIAKAEREAPAFRIALRRAMADRHEESEAGERETVHIG